MNIKQLLLITLFLLIMIQAAHAEEINYFDVESDYCKQLLLRANSAIHENEVGMDMSPCQVANEIMTETGFMKARFIDVKGNEKRPVLVLGDTDYGVQLIYGFYPNLFYVILNPNKYSLNIYDNKRNCFCDDVFTTSSLAYPLSKEGYQQLHNYLYTPVLYQALEKNVEPFFKEFATRTSYTYEELTNAFYKTFQEYSSKEYMYHSSTYPRRDTIRVNSLSSDPENPIYFAYDFIEGTLTLDEKTTSLEKYMDLLEDYFITTEETTQQINEWIEELNTIENKYKDEFFLSDFSKIARRFKEALGELQASKEVNVKKPLFLLKGGDGGAFEAGSHDPHGVYYVDIAKSKIYDYYWREKDIRENPVWNNREFKSFTEMFTYYEEYIKRNTDFGGAEFISLAERYYYSPETVSEVKETHANYIDGDGKGYFKIQATPEANWFYVHPLREGTALLDLQPTFSALSLVIDNSGSIRKRTTNGVSTNLPKIRNDAVKSFLAKIPSNLDAYHVNVFGPGSTEQGPSPTNSIYQLTSKEQINTYLNENSGSGQTWLYTNIQKSIMVAPKNSLLVVFTDGCSDTTNDDECDPEPGIEELQKNIIEQSKEKEITIYFIGVGETSQKNVEGFLALGAYEKAPIYSSFTTSFAELQKSFDKAATFMNGLRLTVDNVLFEAKLVRDKTQSALASPLGTANIPRNQKEPIQFTQQPDMSFSSSSNLYYDAKLKEFYGSLQLHSPQGTLVPLTEKYFEVEHVALQMPSRYYPIPKIEQKKRFNLTLILDDSGSMGEPVNSTNLAIRIDVLKNALKTFLDSNPTTIDKVDIILFNQGYVLTSDDHVQVKQAIDSIQAYGGTPGLPALREAKKVLEQNKRLEAQEKAAQVAASTEGMIDVALAEMDDNHSSKIVILFTDGAFGEERGFTWNEYMETMTYFYEEHVPLIFIDAVERKEFTTNPLSYTGANINNALYMKIFAEATGGMYMPANGMSDLSNKLTGAVAAVTSLEFNVPIPFPTSANIYLKGTSQANFGEGINYANKLIRAQVDFAEG